MTGRWKKSSRAICRTPTTGCRNGWHIVRAITITRREKETKKTFNKSSDRCQTILPQWRQFQVKKAHSLIMNRKIITPEISINKRIYKKKQLTKLLFVLFLDFLICLMNKLTRIKEGKNTRCRHVMQFTPKSKRKTRNRQHYLSLLVSSSFSFAKLVFSLFCRGLSGEPNAVC